MRTPTTLLAAGLALLLAGCGDDSSGEISEQVAEEIAEAADGANVDIEDGEITIEGEDGSMTIDPETGEMVIEGPDGEATYSSGSEIPEDLPDAPQFEDATVDGAGRIEDSGTVTWTISGSLEDPEGAYEALVADLESDGWEITSQTTMTSPEFTGYVSATKDDLELTATASAGDPASFNWLLSQTAG